LSESGDPVTTSPDEVRRRHTNRLDRRRDARMATSFKLFGTRQPEFETESLAFKLAWSVDGVIWRQLLASEWRRVPYNVHNGSHPRCGTDVRRVCGPVAGRLIMSNHGFSPRATPRAPQPNNIADIS
jgi:hypothetical protein